MADEGPSHHTRAAEAHGVFWLKREDVKADTRKSLFYLKKSADAGSPAAKEDLLEALWADESTPDEEVSRWLANA